MAYPKANSFLKALGVKNANLKIRQGLDLQGGTELIYQADMSKVASQSRAGALTGVVDVIQRRLNGLGTSEVVVQTSGNDRVIVELPGIKNVTDAISLIGQTAQLAFYEVPATATTSADYIPTGITGKDVDRADADFDATQNQPIVRLTLKSGDSTKKFADVTTKINRAGDRLVTLLDQNVIFGPATVQNPITDGSAQLSGNFTVAEAKQIAQLINDGALPVPIHLVEQSTVGPSLGHESVQRSIVAGIIGLAIVAIFMLVYYRLLGLVAVLALAIYTLVTLSLYKLSSITSVPIVLTLAGIAGFILSIGMAVDANILIFERMKEELRSGKSMVAAMENGFDRAWTSIRDSNASTLITCLILFWRGATIIKGFAVTLGLGVLISMFTAVVISRTLLRMVIKTKRGEQMIDATFGVKPEEAKS